MYFLKEQYAKNLTEVTNEKNTEGLSGADKMLMNSSKPDEGIGTLADLNIDFTMKRIRKDIDVPLYEEEIDYYIKNHKPDKLQVQLVCAYYAKYFGSFRDLNLLRRRDYITLLLLLKKKLLIELGYTRDEEGNLHFASLPYILTGNLVDRVNTRMIRSTRFNEALEADDQYKELCNVTYKMLGYIKPDYIKTLLSSFINSRFTYVTYEQPELLGTEILYPENKIASEMLQFLKSI